MTPTRRPTSSRSLKQPSSNSPSRKPPKPLEWDGHNSMPPEIDPNLPPQTDEQPEPVAPQPEIEPTVPPIVEPPVVEPPKDEIDYKAKFAASTSEAQILAARLAELEKNSKGLTNEPTDSDLQAAFPDVDWTAADNFTKSIARKTLAAERVTSSFQQKEQEREAAVRWNTDLEFAIASNPTLQGKEQAFKAFASKPTHKELRFLRSCQHSSSKLRPLPHRTPTPKAPGLLPGNGGPRGPEKAKIIAPEALKRFESPTRRVSRISRDTRPVRS